MSKTPERPTQKQLREIGISQAYASELLAGKKVPSLAMAHRICVAFGYPAHEWLLGAAPRPERAIL